MINKIRSIKCNLIIKGEPVSAVLKHYNRNDMVDTARSVKRGCLSMLEGYASSDKNEMVLSFRQVRSIGEALEHKIGECLQGRYEPDIKEIKISFKDANQISQAIEFTLTKL